MRKKYILFFGFLFLYFLNSTALAASKLNGQLWAPDCERLKKKSLTNKDVNIVFTKKTNIQNEQAHWTLHWNNIDIPIPTVSYKDIYILPNTKNEYEIWLRTNDGVIISLMVGEDKLFEDVLAQTSRNRELISTPEGILATKKMFGGPVKMSTIMKLGYKNTPDQLKCMEENRFKEYIIASALLMKNAATDNLVAVYKGIGEYDGWITKSKNENIIEFTINIIADKSSQFLYIDYRMPEDSKYESLPFCVGSKKHPIKDTPGWLVSLNNALEMKTNESWKEFIANAKLDGISEKSISKIYKTLNIKP
jgi:hypothetical protein